MAEEAREQGGVLTQEDLGVLLSCDERAVRRDIRELRKIGIHVPTRGFLHDIGPALSHKAQAIRHWLDGKEPVAITRAINHSLRAVERYLEDFKRVALLVMKGLKSVAINRATPAYHYRFDELRQMAASEPAAASAADETSSGKKGGFVSDPLFVPRQVPNETAFKDHPQKTYGPQVQKTFLGALEAFLCTEFPQLAGTRARRAIAQGLTELVHQFFLATTHLRSGQTTWVSVAKDETSAYGKTIPKTRLVSVIVTLIADDEAKQLRDGKRLRDIKRDAVARICNETDVQGGCITAAELAIMLKTTPTTIGRYIADWQDQHDQLLPRRGTIHDMGPTLTHKKEICQLLFLEGKTVSETMRLTKHSAHAVDRYITNFRQVFTCKTAGLNLQETARATKLSQRLVTEYHHPA